MGFQQLKSPESNPGFPTHIMVIFFREIASIPANHWHAEVKAWRSWSMCLPVRALPRRADSWVDENISKIRVQMIQGTPPTLMVHRFIIFFSEQNGRFISIPIFGKKTNGIHKNADLQKLKTIVGTPDWCQDATVFPFPAKVPQQACCHPLIV